jgi:hypothetical protein
MIAHEVRRPAVSALTREEEKSREEMKEMKRGRDNR